MGLLWIFLVAAIILVVAGVRNIWRRRRGATIRDYFGKPVPWQFDAIFIAFGAIGIISAVPGLIFGQPHWAIDHLWLLIGKLSGNAA